jgi:hypothetical protein
MLIMLTCNHMSLFDADLRIWKDSGIYMYQFVTMQESEIYSIYK